MHRRSARALLGAVLALGVVVPVLEAPPAAATQTCDRPPAAAGPIADVPWPQLTWDPATTVWPFSRGQGVTVAVLDTGVQASAPALAGHVLPGSDLLRGGPADVDCVPHGTGLAGVVVAGAEAGVGLRGLAPDAQVLPVQVTDQPVTSPQAPPADPARVAAGIDAAVAAGAAVVVVGVVLYDDDAGVAEAVQRALGAGVVVVAPVGDGQDDSGEAGPTPYPAAYDGVLGVGAVGPDGLRADTSLVSDEVDLVAPGVAVVSTAPGGQTVYEGTAFAAAYVGAAAALLVAQPGSDLPTGPERAAAVGRQLTATAVLPPTAQGYGAGLLSPGRALTEPLTDAEPAAVAGNTPPPTDTAAQAAAEAADRAADRSTAWALGLGGVAALVLVLALVVPRARGRRWRAGRPGPARRVESDPAFVPGDALFRAPPLP